MNAVFTPLGPCDRAALSSQDVSRNACYQAASEKRKSGKGERSCFVCDVADNTMLSELGIPERDSCDEQQSVHTYVRSTSADQETAARPLPLQSLTRSPPGLTDFPITVNSIGSAQHENGNCKPCAWFWKVNGCQNGQLCLHCHLCPRGEHKARRKARLSARCSARNSTIDGVAERTVVGTRYGCSGSSSLCGSDVAGSSSSDLDALNARVDGNSSRTSTVTSSALPLSLFTALGLPLSALTTHDTKMQVPSEHRTAGDTCRGGPQTLRILPLL